MKVFITLVQFTNEDPLVEVFSSKDKAEAYIANLETYLEGSEKSTTDWYLDVEAFENWEILERTINTTDNNFGVVGTVIKALKRSLR